LYCWGRDSNQELGNGNPDTSSVDTPALVAGGLSFSHISAGAFHTCAVTTANQAYCWGNDMDGQLGNGGALTATQSSPSLVLGGILFAKIYTNSANSGYTSCGISTTGVAYCWGNNWTGQLGSSGGSSNVPRAVLGNLTFQELAMGDDHTCGITTQRDMYCWGQDSSQQLGDGNADTSSDSVPGLVSGGLKFRAVSAGNNFTVGLVE
jgi:alpha-tubulin suppressor-like RCC1 family protein